MTAENEQRAALRPHSTGTSDAAWDSAANRRRLRDDERSSYYARAHAWRNPDGDGTDKADWSFLHHFVSEDGEIGDASTRACSNGIGILNGGRGGGPGAAWWGDRRGLWRHLARHLEDADMEPPELQERSLDRGIERRAFDLTEIRAERGDDGQPSKIVGHAAVFDQLSLPIWRGFRERIRPGAFRKTLREADVRALFNHDPNYVLGRTKNGTLSLREDKVGLRFDVEAPDTTWARDLMTSIERGDIDQASFGFRVVKDEIHTKAGEGFGETVRELIEVQLLDVSPVTFPAYPQTSVEARDLARLGIAWDALAGVLARADLGLALTSTDRDIIQSTIEVLNRYLPAEPGQGPHSEVETEGPGQGRRLSLLRRRLEIAEKELV